MKTKNGFEKLLKRSKISILHILLIGFLFASFHNYFHNKYDHAHDASCSVYVLEQLYFGVDVVEIAPIFTLFIPFAFVLFIPYYKRIKVQKHFTIRAPPIF
jgi:hypothetical protein